MAIFDVKFYDADPSGILSRSVGATVTWSGPAAPVGAATITDNESGVGGQTLDDDSAGRESATANVTINDLTSTNSTVDAELVWTLRDTVTGQQFQVAQFQVENGGASGYYTLSEMPLVAGRDYEVMAYDSNPDASSGDIAFSYADYVESDGVVAGSSGDDIIDASYTGDPENDLVDDGVGTGGAGMGDTIDAGAGDDTVAAGAGADTVYGGAGRDTIDGGAGDDTIYGDAPAATAQSEDLNWAAEGNDGASVAGGFTQSTGQMNVSVSTASDGNNSPTFQVETSDTAYVASGESFDPNSNLYLYGAGDAATSTTTLDFSAAAGSGLSDAVENVQFRINDIDSYARNHQDIVTIRAYGADGKPIAVSIAPSGGDTVSGDTASGYTITADSSYDDPDSASGSALISIAGPVARIEIAYRNGITPSGGNAGTHAIWVSDVEFQTMPASGDDDVIDGGTGDDTIFAGDGSDTITFQDGFGSDTVAGGEGGTDYDTLDFSALGAPVSGSYGGDEAGTLNDGTNSVSFSEIEHLVLTDLDDTVDASADSAGVDIDAGAGADVITGGSGDDVIDGDAGDDTIAGGTGADIVDGGAGDDTIYVAEGDSATGGDGDDTFTLTDLGEAGSAGISITGGEGAETAGDTLDFQGLIGFKDITYTNTDDASGGLSGFASLADGSVVNFSEIETIIICFAAGTHILTPRGERPVESLRPGDLVITADSGLQRVRWTGRREVPAQGNLAPVRIRQGVLGNTRDLIVSPQHRMLCTGHRAELLFSQNEVLVPALHLVDGKDVLCEAGGTVTYVHILFDRHEVVFAEGVPSESFHPGHMGLEGIADPAREELFAVFPELRSNIGSYGPTSRLVLRKHEALALRAA